MPDDLTRLADTLTAADRDRAAELEHLLELDGDQITYLEHVGDRDDPATDGIEGRCV